MKATTVLTNEALIEIMKSYGFKNPKLSGLHNIDVTFDIDFRKSGTEIVSESFGYWLGDVFVPMSLPLGGLPN